jgi:hypothetical protein
VPESRFGRWALPTTIVWSLAVMVTHSDAGVPFPAWMILVAVTILVVVWSLLGLAVAALSAWRDGADVRPASAVWIRSVIWIAATFAAVWLMLPLRARLFLSGPALRQSAGYLAALPPERFATSPPWIGLFRVKAFENYDGELRFLTTSCGFIDQCGLVFSSGGRPPHRGKDTFEHLYAEWWLLYQRF